MTEVNWRLDSARRANPKKTQADSSVGRRIWLLAGSWWEALISHHMDFSMGLLKCSHDTATDFPKEVIQKNTKWKLQCLL